MEARKREKVPKSLEHAENLSTLTPLATKTGHLVYFNCKIVVCTVYFLSRSNEQSSSFPPLTILMNILCLMY